MRKRGQLITATAPATLTAAIVALCLLPFDSADAPVYIGLLLLSIVMMLGAVVSYLHRLMYGEDDPTP